MNIILGHEAHDPTHLNVKLLLSSSISTAGWSLLWLGCSRCLMETKKEKHIQVKITATQKLHNSTIKIIVTLTHAPSV